MWFSDHLTKSQQFVVLLSKTNVGAVLLEKVCIKSQLICINTSLNIPKL